MQYVVHLIEKRIKCNAIPQINGETASICSIVLFFKRGLEQALWLDLLTQLMGRTAEDQHELKRPHAEGTT